MSAYYNKIPETGGGLRSPIRDTYVNMIKDYIMGEIDRVDGVVESVLDQENYDKDRTWRNITDDTVEVLNNRLIKPKVEARYKDSPNKALLRMIKPICNYYKSHGVEVPDEFTKDYLSGAVKSLNLFKFIEFRIYNKLQDVIAEVEILKGCGTLKNHYVSEDLFEDAVVNIYNTFVIVDWSDKKHYSIYPFELLVCWRDIMLKRAIAKLLAESKFSKMGANYPSPKCVESVFNWGNVILSELGNEGYSTISEYESFLTGTILSVYDKFDNTEFLDTIFDDITKHDNANITEATLSLYDELLDCNKCQVVQCFGLFKMWAFPIVDEIAAMSALIEYGRCVKEISDSVMEYLDAIERRQFFLSYRHLHNRDPVNAYYSGLITHHLYKVVERSHDFDENDPTYELLHWRDVKVRGSIEPIFDVDIGAYMKDKAISPELDQLWTVYNKEYVPDEVRSEEGCKVRSGIQRYLKGDILSAKQLIDYVSKHGADEAWKVIGVTAKEKEHKPTARLFAMLTLHMKLWFAITEDCLKTALFKFFPQQSMDQTSSQSNRKKSKMANLESDDVIKIVMNIDFSKWNTTFRYENTHLVFLFIDEVFNFENVYTYTHQFFEQCRVYVSSKFCVPPELMLSADHEDSLSPLTEGTTWFHGFLGGFEGQRQKGWTLVTLLLMIYVIEVKAELRDYELYGQGDNQVLCIIFKKSELCPSISDHNSTPISVYQDAIKLKIDLLKDCLAEATEEIGLKVKIEETWFSNAFFQYSKDFYINGAKMPMDLKQLVSISPHTKLICPTQEDIFRAMTSSVVACLDHCHSTLATYFCGMYISTALILTHDQRYSMITGYSANKVYRKDVFPPFDRLITKQGDEFLFMMLLIPSCMGGMSDFRMGSLLRKGAGDHLESALDFAFRSRSKEFMFYLKNLVDRGMHDSANTDRSILIANPYSINLKIHPGTGLLAKGVKEYLKENAGGYLRTALDALDSVTYREFCKELIPDSGYDPVLAQLMFSLSAYSPIQSQIEKLDGSSLTRMANIRIAALRSSVKMVNQSKIDNFADLANKHYDLDLYKEMDDDMFCVNMSEAIAEDLRKFWGLKELILPCNKFDPDITLISNSTLRSENNNEIRRKGDVLLIMRDVPIKDDSGTVNDESHDTQNREFLLKMSRGPCEKRSKVTNVPSILTTNIEIAHGSVSKNVEKLADIYPTVTMDNDNLARKIKKQLATVTDFRIESAIDYSNDKKTLLLETCELSSASNFCTFIEYKQSPSIKNEPDEEIRFQHTKAVTLGIALLEIQYTVNTICGLPMDKTYWLLFNKGFNPIRRSQCSYDFEPSTLTYPPDSMYFAQAVKPKYKPSSVKRRTDAFLRCAMMIDAAYAQGGLINGSGVSKMSIPYQSIRENMTLFSMMACLRYLMFFDLSLNINPSDLVQHILIGKRLKAVTGLFKYILIDINCMSQVLLEIPSFLSLFTDDQKALAIMRFGLQCAREVYHVYSSQFCKLFPLYDRNETQYDFIFERTARFLLKDANTVPAIEDFTTNNESDVIRAIGDFYETVMVKYGKKHSLILGPVRTAIFYDINYPRVITDDWKERYDYDRDFVCHDPIFIALGIFTALSSIVEQFSYKVVLIEKTEFNDRIWSIVKNLLKGKNFHGKFNLTLVFFSIQSTRSSGLSLTYSVFGEQKLEVTNGLVTSNQPVEVCMELSDKILYVGCGVSCLDGIDCLLFRGRGCAPNVGSVFTNGLHFSSKIGDVYFPTLSDNWSASALMSDWMLSLILIDDLKELDNDILLPSTLSSESIDDLLTNYGYTTLALIEKINNQNEHRIGRLMRARDNISDVRLEFVSRRLRMSQRDVEKRRGYVYYPSRNSLRTVIDLSAT